MPPYYISRINRMLRIAQLCGIPRDGCSMVELGTGWCHWEAMTARLFFDVRGVLYDVWDNRQLSALKNYLAQLDASLETIDATPERRARAREIISRLKDVQGYDDFYKLLGFEYVVEPEGLLRALKTEAFDLVVSAGVLEHIPAKTAGSVVGGIARALKPGGYSVHSINIRDHLYLYDTSVSPKQYLHYSHGLWRLCFENDVQYINRLQRPEWHNLFKEAGLILVEEEVDEERLTGLKISPAYHGYGEADLRCAGLGLVHRKQ
jgi:SAM-dependent methyltransferase